MQVTGTRLRARAGGRSRSRQSSLGGGGQLVQMASQGRAAAVRGRPCLTRGHGSGRQRPP
eukprot:7653807-Alexandrium_andersonii.AAC.1